MQMASKGCLCGEKVGITGALKIRKCTIYSQVWIYRSPFRSKKEYVRACLGKASDPVADHLEATAFFRKSGGPQDALVSHEVLFIFRDIGHPCLVPAWLWRISIPLALQSPHPSTKAPGLRHGSAGHGLERQADRGRHLPSLAQTDCCLHQRGLCSPPTPLSTATVA